MSRFFYLLLALLFSGCYYAAPVAPPASPPAVSPVTAPVVRPVTAAVEPAQVTTLVTPKVVSIEVVGKSIKVTKSYGSTYFSLNSLSVYHSGTQLTIRQRTASFVVQMDLAVDLLTIDGVPQTNAAVAAATLEPLVFAAAGGGALTLSPESLAAGHSIVDEVLDIDAAPSDYDYISINGDFSFVDYEGDATYITLSDSLGPGERTITYGAFNNQLTLTLAEGETETFVFNAVTGWQLFNEARPDPEAAVFADSPTGIYRVCVLEDDINIGTTDTTVLTGCDLTQPDLYIEFEYSDTGGTVRAWQTGKLRVDRIIERFEAGDTVDGYNLVFDNDFVVINLVDPATGEFALRYSGRNVGVTHVEVFQLAQEVPAVIPVIDFEVFTTNGVFQNVGDANPLFTTEDGAKVFIQYGDGNRDCFTFLDGTARAERRGLSVNDIEVQIVDGQIGIRDLGSASGIARAWYQLPVKAIGTGGVGGSIELGPNATARGITLEGGVLETPIGNDDNRGRYELATQSLRGQPSGNGQFPFSESGLTHFSSSVVDNGDNTYTITTRGSPWLVTADTKTAALTGAATRVSYIHDVSTPATTRIAGATDGRFGNAQPDIPAMATIPPNTTITVDVRSANSGGSQFLTVGASLDFAEVDTSHEALTLSAEAVTAGYSLTEQELSVPVTPYQSADPVSYVDAAGDGFTVLAYSDGTFTTIDKNREYIVGLQSLPPDFVEFTELAPSLPNEQNFPNFFYQDVNNFIVNSQQNVNGATLIWEMFFEGVDFELSNITTVNGNDVVTGTATLVSQQQPDGTWNHRITSDQAVAAFQPIRIRGTVTAGGQAAGGGAGTEPDYFQFYSN